MSGKTLNSCASLLTIIMGFGHFFVPVFLPWEEHLQLTYPPLSWALYAMNFFFSFLLTWGGLLTFVFFQKQTLRLWIVGGMALFWAASAVYLLVIPFPLPEARWVLPVYSLLVAGLYVGALRRGDH